MLLDLQDDTVHKHELALEDDIADNRTLLMRTLDKLTTGFGRGTLMVAGEGLKGRQAPWSMRQQRRTPNYMTNWKEMPVAKAG